MESPVYLNVKQPPFRLYGFSEPFRRLPAEVAELTSECVTRLADVTTGGRVRFKTTSDFIVVHGEIKKTNPPTISSPVAAKSFDIYFKENGKHYFRGIFSPSQGEGKSYVESRLKFYHHEMKDITIFFPLETSFYDVYIGLREGSEVDFPSDYTYEKPIVFYGSSIVHGGGSRPSSPYSAILSRRLDSNFINLGFGGGAKAEKSIMEYISGLDMSVFVYDYDHNAPSFEYLRDTHYEGYRIFRAKQPNTPIIMASRPDYWSRNFTLEYYDVTETERRRRLIEDHYKRARAEGDDNVYFVDGSLMYPSEVRDDCSSDGCHPNDLGYHYMANAFEAVIKPLLH